MIKGWIIVPNKARGLDIEPQPKRGKALQERAHRGAPTDKIQTFEAVKLRNMHRILRRPEVVFEIVTRSHATTRLQGKDKTDYCVFGKGFIQVENDAVFLGGKYSHLDRGAPS